MLLNPHLINTNTGQGLQALDYRINCEMYTAYADVAGMLIRLKFVGFSTYILILDNFDISFKFNM